MISRNAGSFRTRDGWQRRQVLQLGGGLFGFSLPGWLRGEAVAEQRQPKCKSVIFMMLFGGPSPLETYDIKPLAPDIIRGPFQPTASRMPGRCRFTEEFKEETVKMLLSGHAANSVAERLGLGGTKALYRR